MLEVQLKWDGNYLSYTGSQYPMPKREKLFLEFSFQNYPTKNVNWICSIYYYPFLLCKTNFFSHNATVYCRVCSWCAFYGFVCLMTYIHHYNVIQSIFTALNTFCAMPIYLSLSLLSPVPGNHWSCLHSFFFSRMSYHWHHIVCRLFRFQLFSLNNKHLWPLHVFSWLHSSFLFSTE